MKLTIVSGAQGVGKSRKAREMLPDATIVDNLEDLHIAVLTTQKDVVFEMGFVRGPRMHDYSTQLAALLGVREGQLIVVQLTAGPLTVSDVLE